MFTQPPFFQNVQFTKQNPVRKKSVFKVSVYTIFYQTSLLCTVLLCILLKKKFVEQQFNMGAKDAEFYPDFQSVEKAAKSYQ